MKFIEGFNVIRNRWVILYCGPEADGHWKVWQKNPVFRQGHLKLIEVRDGQKIVVDRIYPKTLDD